MSRAPATFRRLLLVLGAVGAFACSSTSSVLVQRFAREHSCQPDAVRVREQGGNAYLAEGCGQQAEYVCSTFVSVSGKKAADGCVERGNVPRHSGPPEQRLANPSLDPPK